MPIGSSLPPFSLHTFFSQRQSSPTTAQPESPAIPESEDTVTIGKKYWGCTDNENKLLNACKSGSAKQVESALIPDVDVNARDNSQCNAIHLLAQNKNITPSLVQQLVDKGADLKSVNAGNLTPLHALTQNDNVTPALVKRFLKHGANINAYSDFQGTPLDTLAENENITPELVKLFLDQGANLNEETLGKLLKAGRNNPQILKFLIENNKVVNAAGTDEDDFSIRKQTAWHLERNPLHKEIFKAISSNHPGSIPKKLKPEDLQLAAYLLVLKDKAPHVEQLSEITKQRPSHSQEAMLIALANDDDEKQALREIFTQKGLINLCDKPQLSKTQFGKNLIALAHGGELKPEYLAYLLNERERISAPAKRTVHQAVTHPSDVD